MLPQPGHIFENKYRILGMIGAGGFAQVYHAEFEDVGRQVAIKILTPHEGLGTLLYPMEIDRRFLREAKMLSELRDPHTVIMHDFGRSQSGLLYMVFEYIDGQPLNDLIRDHGPQPPKLVKRILEQVLTSLREAHSKGILHRDIKPANIMLYEYMGDASHVKLLDFGIAKPVGSEKSHELTQDGTMMGTPRYMSPEQIVGQQMGPAADVYSLGLCAYELLTGQPAIPETLAADIMRKQLSNEEFPLPASIPPALKNVVENMNRKVLSYRYQTADDVLSALRAIPDSALDGSSSASASGGFAAQTGGTPFAPATPSAPQSWAQSPPSAQSSGFGSGVQVPAQNSGWGQPASATPTGFGSGAHANPAQNSGWGQPGGGFTPASQMPGTTPMNGGAMMHQNPAQPAVHATRPADTVIALQRTATGLDIEFPARLTKDNMVALGGASALLFLVVWLGFWLMLLPAAAAGLFALGFTFKTAELHFDKAAGTWHLKRSFLVFDRESQGSLGEVVCLREETNENKPILRLVTQNKSHDVTNNYSPGEFAWVVAETTNFLNQR